jgi:hypothetical protein
MVLKMKRILISLGPVDVLEIQTDLFQTCHLVILGHRMILNFAIEIFAAILPEQVLSYTL